MEFSYCEDFSIFLSEICIYSFYIKGSLRLNDVVQKIGSID